MTQYLPTENNVFRNNVLGRVMLSGQQARSPKLASRRYRMGQLASCSVEGQPNPAYPGSKNLWHFDYDTNVNGKCQLINIRPGTGPRPTPCVPAGCEGSPTPELTTPSQPTTTTPATGPGGAGSGGGIQPPILPGGTLAPGAVTPATPGALPGGQMPTSGSTVIPPGFGGDGGTYGPTLPTIIPLPSGSKPGAVPVSQPSQPASGPINRTSELVSRMPMPQARAAAIQPGQRFAMAPVYPGPAVPTEQVMALREVIPADIEAILATWPEKPKELARELIGRYGPPQDACKTRLVWFNNGEWRVTTLFRDGIPHYWPKVHQDYLEQMIDFKVDPELYDSIARFDGSVIPDRTRGTLTARCDNEPMNFLAINLARDIAVGELSIDAAREIYVEAAKMYMDGQFHPYAEGIMFQLPTEYQGDPDIPVFEGNGSGY